MRLKISIAENVAQNVRLALLGCGMGLARAQTRPSHASPAIAHSLVAGDVRGDLDRLYARVSSVNVKHGPFAMLLCVGDFLGQPEGSDAVLAPYRSGERTVPLRTYMLAGNVEPALDPVLAAAGPGGELAPDLVYLGAAGVTELADLRVAFLSGGSAGSALPKDAVASLHAASASSDFGGVDLLLSCAWPKGFYHHLDPTSLPADLLPGKDLPDVGLDALAGLAVTLRPRFHFCGGEDQFWQRPPFRLPASQHVCRLVGLSCVQEDKKQTWLKAFALVPAATMGGAAPPQPAETTDCPYPQALLVASAASGASAASPAASEQECNDFKLGKCTRGDKCRFRHVEGEPRAKRPKPDYAKDTRGWVSESCWFCTSSPQFESQLVASVGSACYLTLAKGPLVPNHCLLIPVSHAPCSLALSAEESAEMRTYLDALRTCFAKRGQAMLVFERHMGVSAGRAGFEHMHLQARTTPVPQQPHPRPLSSPGRPQPEPSPASIPPHRPALSRGRVHAKRESGRTDPRPTRARPFGAGPSAHSRGGQRRARGV